MDTDDRNAPGLQRAAKSIGESFNGVFRAGIDRQRRDRESADIGAHVEDEPGALSFHSWDYLPRQFSQPNHVDFKGAAHFLCREFFEPIIKRPARDIGEDINTPKSRQCRLHEIGEKVPA